MKGFIRITDRDESPMLVSVTDIVRVTVDDPYHPNQYARIALRDGTTIKTSWRHNVESVEALIVEASA